MPLVTGTRLGAYEILAVIGAGGMGEVYRARDTKLGRDVAIKVLPEAFAADPDRLARFKREAQVLAALNHPNIAAIYGLEESGGASAIVMELVEGPTLADRLSQGAMPLDEALPIAHQIAEALEAAHEQGVMHRDLKPANIKVRDDGVVKVLDFGLAKAFAGDATDPNVTNSPTMSLAATRAGVILGTAAYMSPEQARGKAVDKRTDIWAFGCVLFEMLTGRRAFEGDEIADILGAIMRAEPDWSLLPAGTPPPIRRLLRRCLAKDRKNRLPEIGTARLEIDDTAAQLSDGAVAAVPHLAAHSRERLAWISAAAAVVALIAALATAIGLYTQRLPEETRAYRSSILPPPDTFIVSPTAVTDAGRMALSPNGQHLAFVATASDGKQTLWVRPLNEGSARPLNGTDGASSPFWSPDSRFLAFFADGKLKRLDVAGGPAVTLSDAAGPAVGGTWNRDDIILFALNGSPLQRVSVSGGKPVAATVLDTQAGETSHWSPLFLPDARHFLYFAVTGGAGGTQGRGVYVGSLDSNEKTLVFDGGSNTQYAAGYLFFVRDATLMAQPFDANQRELTGNAIPLAEQLYVGGTARLRGVFSVSESGVIAFQTGAGNIQSRLIWRDRAGKPLSQVGDAAEYGEVELSPDGTQAAVTILDGTRRTFDIWLYDVARGLRTRLTSDPADDMEATWSPDGSRIVFVSRRKGIQDIYEKPVGGQDEVVLLEDKSYNKWLGTWSRDGRFLLFSKADPVVTRIDTWLLPLFGDRKPRPYLQTTFTNNFAKFSPNGRWVVYRSDESGRAEIYVASFPNSEGKRLISTAGGAFPRWSRDGREIFYVSASTLMAATVNGEGAAFEVGAVRSLFNLPATPSRISNYQGWRYDVSIDSQRFLVETPVEQATSPPMTLLVNWTAGLKK